MTRTLLFAIATLLFASTGFASPTPAQLDAEDSKLTFVAFTSLFDVEGTFKSWSVSGDVDPVDFERSRVEVKIDASSIDTGNGSRDEHLRDPDFLEVERYPQITFVTSTVKPAKDGVYAVTGKLTIKGTTRTLTIPLAVERRGEQLSVRGVLNVDRFDYGIDYESGFFKPTVKRQVNIRLDLLFDL